MVDQISPGELRTMLHRNTVPILLLDVREEDERAAAAIEPSLHIPMQEIPGRTGEIPKDRKIVVYCHHGSRSEMVAGFLESQGYPDVVNLDGGIDRWSQTVDPKVPRY